MNEGTVSASDYQDYEIWKGWDKLFTCSLDQADYYLGETRDIAITAANVLEIGFGAGEFLRWAADKGARTTGTEVNPALIDAARQRGIPLLDSDIEHVADKHANFFDTIVAFDVFEHFTFDELDARLRACETMLKPGGKLLLRFPNAQSPFGLAPQYGDPTHRVCLSAQVLEHFILSRALEIERCGRAYRARGRSLKARLGRMVRHVLRDLISRLLNFTYATQITYDPVLTVVIRKNSSRI